MGHLTRDEWLTVCHVLSAKCLKLRAKVESKWTCGNMWLDGNPSGWICG